MCKMKMIRNPVMKCLHIIRVSSDNSDDTEMLWQMGLFYCRSNRCTRLFNMCSQNVPIELCRSFCTFIVPSIGLDTKRCIFLNFESQTIMSIIKNWVSSDKIVLWKSFS